MGRRVNGARDDDAGLLEPVELEAEEPRGVPAKRRAADEGGAGGGGQLDLF